jgi:hypothetical protein
LNLSYLFDAIDITSLDPRRFSSHLVTAWQKIRFANPPQGYAGSDEIGAALLSRDNFAWKSSGWFDENGITFPLDMLRRDRIGIEQHLEWMIDCRRDSDAIQYLWKSLKKKLKRDPLPGQPRRFELPQVASRLHALLIDEPSLGESLLSGRLAQAFSWFEDQPKSSNTEKHLQTTWSMLIIWALFDLQVIAYRLFHAEWNATDAGMDNSLNMSGQTLEKVGSELLEFATKADFEFRRGMSLNDVPADLANFIATYDLERHARRHVAALGIASGDLMKAKFEVGRYLEFLSRFMGLLVARLRRQGNVPSEDVVTYIKQQGRKLKVRTRPKSKLKRPMHESVASLRFDLPPLAGLYFAVENVIEQLSAVQIPVGLPEGRSKKVFDCRAQSSISRDLFTIYRDLFVRPAKNGHAKIGDVERAKYEQEASAQLAEGKPDPGLEKLGKGHGVPLNPGVPAIPQLATVDGAAVSRNDEKPGGWKAREVSSAHRLPKKAVDDILANPEDHGDMADRAKRADRTFRNVVTNRIQIA